MNLMGSCIERQRQEFQQFLKIYASKNWTTDEFMCMEEAHKESLNDFEDCDWYDSLMCKKVY